jgi:DNA-binding IclR family transcriptional regulator
MIQVIGRALDILELIAQKPDKIKTLSEIADTLKLNHGTCANIIKTLVGRNYIEKVDGKKGYKLGSKVFALAANRDNKSELIAAAQEEMESLTKKFNENTLLSVLRGDQRVAILRVNSHNQLQAVTATEKEAFNSSTGKLLVAMLSDEELEEYLRQYGLPKMRLQGGKKITRLSFYNEIKKIRTEGVATHLPDDEVFGMAVPICKSEKVVASLSIYLPAYRYNEKLHRQMHQQLLISARKISNKL